MFGIFKGFKEFIFGPAVKVKSPTETEAPYKIEQPAVVEPVSVETTLAQPSLAVIDTTSVVETAIVEIPAKKPRKPRTKTKVAPVPAKKPTKSSVVSIAEVKKGKGKSKKS
jgi:hypothetical protein